jgi:hypothetical protein
MQGCDMAHWTGFFTHQTQQFFIVAPSSITASAKSSLVSLLEIAEMLGCKTTWMLVDRRRPDFISVVSAFKYLGFQLSQGSFEDPKDGTHYAFLRYEFE